MMKNLITFPNSTKPKLWLMIITGLLLSVIFVPQAVAQDTPTLTVVAPVASVREGPGFTHEVITYLLQNDQVSAIGYDAAADWWEVALPNGESGWVNGRPYFVSITGDASIFTEPATPAQPESAINNSPLNMHNSQLDTIIFQTSSGGNIYAINADGTNLRYLTTGIDPVVSPDGQWVAFTRWESQNHGTLGNVWVINVNGTGERVVLENVRQPKSPTWSADGSKITLNYVTGGLLNPTYECSSSRPNAPLLANEDGVYFERKIVIGGGRPQMKLCYTLLPHPSWGLRVVDVNTGEVNDLTVDKFSSAPTWNPTNDWQLVYHGEQGLVSLDMNQNTRWLLTEDVNDTAPVFSPDGSKIAVTFRQDGNWDIHVMNADGSNRQRLTETSYITFVEQQLRGEEPHSYNNAAPAWSPDGSQLVFLTDRTGQWEIWIMNTDGSNQQPLFESALQTQLGLQYNGVEERALNWIQ